MKQSLKEKRLRQVRKGMKKPIKIIIHGKFKKEIEPHIFNIV